MEDTEASDTWTARAPIPTARYGLQPGAINGVIYVVGAGASNTAISTLEAFTAACPLPTPTPTPTPTNNPPVALCHNVTVSAGPDCKANASIDNGSYDPDSGDTITLSPSPSGPYPLGNTTVTLTVTDNHGASSSCTSTVAVVDNTPPTITVPAPTTVTASSSCQAAIPNVVSGTIAGDNCGSVTVTQSPAAGTLVGSGPHTITVTATDAAGNTSTATTTFTVNDATPPTITAPPDASYQCASQVPAANASQATASDSCSTPTVTVSESNNGGTGSPASPLIITRVFTAKDAAGSTASATQTITVKDTTPPTITPPLPVTVYAGAGATSWGAFISDATLGIASAADNCSGAITITRSGIPAGNFFPVGTTTITHAAKDVAGNTATATQLVTVIDNTPPIISCPTDIVVTANLGSNSAAVSYPAPTASDNCGVPIVSCSLPSGSSFPIGTTTVSCAATDSSNNTSSCAFSVTVLTPQDATQQLGNNVNSLVSQGTLSQANANALTAKLQAAISSMNSGNTTAGCNQLDAFINQTQAFINSGKLTSAQGQALIDSAKTLKAVLGC